MRRTKVALVFSFLIIFVNFAHAQWAVFDSTNYANALSELHQAQELYTTANQTRDQIIQAYNLAHYMAQMPQNLARRYSAQFSSWKTLSANGSYGNTSQWLLAANGQWTTASSGYQSAGIVLQSPTESALIGFDERSQSVVKAQYASAQLADGVSTSQLATVSEIRSRSAALNEQLDNLTRDSYSSDPSQQSEMAVLGKINAAALMQLRSQQDTNQLLAANALQQLITAKEQSDQQKRALNQALYFQQNFPDYMGRVTTGMTESIQSISFSTQPR
jgi:hypothetical protein